MDFFEALKVTTNMGGLYTNRKQHQLPKPNLTALPIRANDIKIISTDPRFSADYLPVHQLSHYKAAYAPAQLVPVMASPLDYLIFDTEDIGEPI